MSRRGRMPMPFRILIGAGFLLVFALPLVSMSYGMWRVGTTSAAVMEEYAPTEEDAALAAELRARAEASGQTLEVHAIDIAHARRLGELDKVEAVADELYEPPPPPPRSTTAEASVHHMDGAFYRDDLPPEPEAAFPWGLAAVAMGAMVASIGAGGAAFLTIGRRRD